MRLKINWASLQHIFTETRLEDVDLSKPQPCKYFVYMEWGNSSQDWRVCSANSKLLWHFDYNHLARVKVLCQMQQFMCTVQFLLCFILNLRTISEYKPPGACIWRGDLADGFLRYEFGGLIFSEHCGIWKKLNPLPPNKMVRFGLRAVSSLISEGWEICSSTLFCPRLRISQAVTSLKITTLAQTAQSVII